MFPSVKSWGFLYIFDAFILENLGLDPHLVLFGGFFYQSYKVHLSIKYDSNINNIYNIVKL